LINFGLEVALKIVQCRPFLLKTFDDSVIHISYNLFYIGMLLNYKFVTLQFVVAFMFYIFYTCRWPLIY